jgi:plastocyanin
MGRPALAAGFPAALAYARPARRRCGECPDLTGGETFTLTLSDNEYDLACAQVSRMQGLTLENTGSNSHTFTLDGTSIDVEVPGGETQNLEPPGEALAAGTYTVYCRFHGSADGSGMSMELRVS